MTESNSSSRNSNSLSLLPPFFFVFIFFSFSLSLDRSSLRSTCRSFAVIRREKRGQRAKRGNDEIAPERVGNGAELGVELVERDKRVGSVAGRHLLLPLRCLRSRLLRRSRGFHLSLSQSIYLGSGDFDSWALDFFGMSLISFIIFLIFLCCCL